MRNVIFYLTYNGLYNFTNGIGTQTQLLITGLEALHDELAKIYGSIDLHVICPEPDPQTWGYEHGFYQRQRERIGNCMGKCIRFPISNNPAKTSGASRPGRPSVKMLGRFCASKS